MIFKFFILHAVSLPFFHIFALESDGSESGIRNNRSKRQLETCEWTQIGKSIRGEDSDHELGWTISSSKNGELIAIGVPAPDSFSKTNPNGLVKVFELKKNGVYKQVGEDILGEAKKDSFGVSLAQSNSGKIVAAGAWNADSESTKNTGHVRVFELLKGDEGKEWKQLGQDLDGVKKNDYYGNAVSLSGNGKIIAVSGDDHDNYRGHVRVFELLEKTWVQLGEDIDGESEDNEAGTSVALSANGKYLAIGSPYYTGSTGEYAGHVRVFQWLDKKGKWKQVAQNIEGTAQYNGSGTSVSLSKDGSILAIGAPQHSPTDNIIQAGQVRVFGLAQDSGEKTWVQLGKDITGDSTGDVMGDSHSISLSLDGRRIAVGARGHTPVEPEWYAGLVRVFDYDESSSSWSQIGKDIYGDEAFDQLGFSVSLSGDGNILATGAAYAKNNKGKAKIFELECGE